MAKNKRTPFRAWLDSQPRGTMSQIASKLGVSRQYIHKIAEGDQVISHKKAKELSMITGLGLKNFAYARIVVHVP